jgi:hypothetical protein
LILGIVAIFEAVVIVALLVRKSTSYSGIMRITHTPDSIGFQLELEDDPATLEQADQVVFKVVSDGLNNRVGNMD